MGYFSLRCFSPQIGKYIIIGLNVLVGILGITHWGYAGSYGQLLSYFTTGINSTANESIAKLYASPIAYFSISGIVQVVVSILAILLTLDIIGKENKLLWARIIIVCLVFEFAFDFFIAVYTSMMSTYFTSAFKKQLDATFEMIEKLASTQMKGQYNSIRNFVKFSYAQAIITWILAIPSVCIIIISLTDQLINENTVNYMGVSYNNQVTPQRTMTAVQPIPMNMMGVQPVSMNMMGVQPIALNVSSTQMIQQSTYLQNQRK